MAGRPVDAERSLVAALAQLEARAPGAHDAADRDRLELRTRTLTTLALTELLLRGLEAALARLAEAEQLIEALGDVALRARLEYQRANIHGRVGDLASAWNGLEAAASRLDAFTPAEQCSVHLTRGMLAFQLLHPRQAIDSFADAARLARSLGRVEQEFMARHNEGYAAYLLGDLPRSLSVMADAEELDADVFRGPARLDRGRVLLEAGLVQEAAEALAAGADGLVGGGHDQLRAEFDLELARAHRLMGRLESSTREAAAASAVYAGLGATAWQAKATLVGLLTDLDRERRDRDHHRERRDRDHQQDRPHDRAAEDPGEPHLALRAAATADDLVETATRLGDPELADAARVVAAQGLLLAGDVDAARTRLLGLERVSTGSLSDELDSAAVSAAVLVEAGEPVAARRLLSRAARRLAAGQEGSASLDLRTARAVHGVRLAAIDLDLAVPRGSPAVLEALERWRSATDRLPSLGRPADDELATLTESLRAVRGRLRGEVADEEERELSASAARLERQIRDRDWALSSGSRATGAVPVRVREARERLAATDRDLVWLFAHRDRLCGVGVVGGRAALRDLMPLAEAAELARRMRVDLRAAATHHLGPFAGAVWGSLRSSADRLDRGVVRPWRSGAAGLVIVSCEELSALPWALLPSLTGCPITVAYSLTSFARRERPGSRDEATPPVHVSVHVSVGPQVPRAPGEAAALRDTWRATGRDVEVADPSRSAGLVAALASPGIVHVAAHGVHQVESPLFSSLVLHDGPVFAHELQPTGVAADHVVLSACEVGSASFRPGDEQLGMAAAIFSLGARSVVAAVSPVPDDVAGDAMARHHAGLARGLAGDEALAAAIAASEPAAASFVNLGGRFAAR
ncbi:MAG: CHAT domain-containing protein [Terracoccus sp.]